MVDCLDALASDRQYRKALSLDDAMEIVSQEAGHSYDPQVVKILKERYRELEAKAKSSSVESARVSSNVKVERGASPATGFAPALVATAGEPVPNKNLRMRISDARREFQMLVEIANDLGSSLSLRETLALLAIRLEESIPHDALAIYVRHKDKLVPRYVKGDSFRLFSAEYSGRSRSVGLGGGEQSADRKREPSCRNRLSERSDQSDSPAFGDRGPLAMPRSGGRSVDPLSVAGRRFYVGS